MFFSGFFCGFYRRGGAALCGGTSASPQVAKTVRAILRIKHKTKTDFSFSKIGFCCYLPWIKMV